MTCVQCWLFKIAFGTTNPSLLIVSQIGGILGTEAKRKKTGVSKKKANSQKTSYNKKIKFGSQVSNVKKGESVDYVQTQWLEVLTLGTEEKKKKTEVSKKKANF